MSPAPAPGPAPARGKPAACQSGSVTRRGAMAMVVLRHVQRGGEHYDLMLERPLAAAGAIPGAIPGAGALATWRVMSPPSGWAAAGRLELMQLPDHRRAYLHREGRVSGGRGWVHRVDAGAARVRRWTADQIVVDVQARGFRGTLMMRRVGGARWIAIAREPKPQLPSAITP